MKYVPAAVCLLILAFPVLSSAEWVQDGTLISSQPTDESAPAAIPDGAGGAFVVWTVSQAGEHDLFAQRLAPDGTELWTPGGILLVSGNDDQRAAVLAPDGSGGFVTAWEDERNGGFNELDIYAQRVDANGTTLWTAGGVPVCTAAGQQRRADVYFDGGAILVAWDDTRAGLQDVYVQRVGLDGLSLWAGNGVAAVSLTGSVQQDAVVISNGSSGALVAWQDLRGGTYRVYMQAINFFGTPAWGSGGVGVNTAETQRAPRIVEDGAGGLFVSWHDDGATPDVFLQRRDAAGNELWTTPIAQQIDNQQYTDMISDGAGGVILAWEDSRNDLGDIYAQRVTGQGVQLWQIAGAPVCTSAQTQNDVAIAPDGNGGALVFWDDFRSGGTDIYAQRITAYGAPMWTANGMPVTEAPNTQTLPSVAVDGEGGAIIAWRDSRSPDVNLYAQRIEPDYGEWGQPEPAITSVSDTPGDQGGNVAVNWTASQRDAFLYPEVTHYSIWRAVDAVAVSAGNATALGDITADFEQPVVRRQSTAAGDFYWELVGTQIALRSSGYSYLAATREDSTGAGAAVHNFQVVAHTNDPNVFYVSDAASGYSVDNLAPASPIMLAAERVGNYVRLDWEPGTSEEEPDFDSYAVYRATASGVAPEPAFFLSSTVDTALWDQGAVPGVPYYYIVTAVDFHENESDPSNEASVDGTLTGAGDAPALTSLRVRSNYPNPFGHSTELRIGLPGESNVSVEIYDVRGRRVATVTQPAMAGGWGVIPFDARDETGALLPSGIYFYRVLAGGEVATRKFVIQR